MHEKKENTNRECIFLCRVLFRLFLTHIRFFLFHLQSNPHSAAEFSGFDLESLTTEGRGGRARCKLLIEVRSPMMHSTVEKTLLQDSEKNATNATLDQLYAQAVLLDPIFRVRIQRLAGMSCGYFPVAATHSATSTELRLWSELEQDTAARARVRWPEIKHVDMAIQKMTIHYHGSTSQLVDIVRQRIVFDSVADICECLRIITNDPDLEIVRFKNRFDPRKDARITACYRDVVVVLRVVTLLTTRLGVAGHRCVCVCMTVCACACACACACGCVCLRLHVPVHVPVPVHVHVHVHVRGTGCDHVRMHVHVRVRARARAHARALVLARLRVCICVWGGVRVCV